MEEEIFYKDGKAWIEKKYYKTTCDEFEVAIKKFGVNAALEYFVTPEEEKHNFDSLKE